MARQSQEGGSDATNVQAGRDVVIHQGPSFAAVREIAMEVFRANFMELRGVAEETARTRAEEITNAFMEQLSSRGQAALNSASDPDMQRAIFDAQREYACSGDENLGAVLIDLLVDRADPASAQGMQKIVLNEAINAAPKLTHDQRRAIALCFLMRYTRWKGEGLDAFYEEFIKGNVLPLVPGVPKDDRAYQHIEYVGAGSVGIATVPLSVAIAHKGEGWFTRGFTRQEVGERVGDLLDDGRVVIPCLRDPERLQLSVIDEGDLEDWAQRLGVADRLAELRNMFKMGTLSSEAIREELCERVPEAAGLVAAWDETPLQLMTLTTVGIAIGHGYWRRVTGANAPLSIWIPS